MRTEAAKRNAANAGLFNQVDGVATSLKVCVAESEFHVRGQVLKALGNSGHTIVIAREAADLLRYQCSDEGPDAVVGCAQLLAAIQTEDLEIIKTPALLLARPEDTSFLPAFMKFNSGNDFALLPQSDESLRRSVFSFVLRQHRRKLLGFSAFGVYLFNRDTSQVFFDGEVVKLSPYRFALAEALMRCANIPLKAEELAAACAIEQHSNTQRMIGANIAVLAHQLKLDGRHGYRLEYRGQNAYCVSSLPAMPAHPALDDLGMDVPVDASGMDTFRDVAGLSAFRPH